MAGADRAGVLSGSGLEAATTQLVRHQRADSAIGPEPDRYAAVSRVLVRVLLLNLAVAVAKIAFGYASGAISILSDGFHSLTDARVERRRPGRRARGAAAARRGSSRTATASTRRSRPRRSRCSCCCW